MSTSFLGLAQQQMQMQAQSNAAQWQQGLMAQQLGMNRCGSCGDYYIGQHSCPLRLLGSTTTATNTGTLPKKEKKMSMVREYMNKHRDFIFTLFAAILLDHFLLNGALRKRIQAVAEAALGKCEKALGLPAGGEE